MANCGGVTYDTKTDGALEQVVHELHFLLPLEQKLLTGVKGGGTHVERHIQIHIAIHIHTRGNNAYGKLSAVRTPLSTTDLFRSHSISDTHSVSLSASSVLPASASASASLRKDCTRPGSGGGGGGVETGHHRLEYRACLSEHGRRYNGLQGCSLAWPSCLRLTLTMKNFRFSMVLPIVTSNTARLRSSGSCGRMSAESAVPPVESVWPGNVQQPLHFSLAASNTNLGTSPPTGPHQTLR